MNKANLKLLITRPKPSADKLASTLQAAGYHCLCQPLFDYQAIDRAKEQAKDSRSNLDVLLAKAPQFYIFVSSAAAEFAHKVMPLTKWPTGQFIAIGDTTEITLKKLGIEQVTTPSIHTSEGLLALECFRDVQGQHVLIVRGDGGRELIASELTRKGATTCYFESYQKRWFELSRTDVAHWKKENINGIIITSNALLESVVQLIQDSDNFWQNTCLWLVASERIADKAKALGLKNIICTYGASDHAILETLRNMEQ